MLAASLKASVAWCVPLVLASACCLSALTTTDDILMGSVPTSQHSQMTRELPIQADQRGTQGCAQWGLGRGQGFQGVLHAGAWTTNDVHCCAKLCTSYCSRLLLFCVPNGKACPCKLALDVYSWLSFCTFVHQVVTLSDSCVWIAVGATVRQTCTGQASLHTLVRRTRHHWLTS